ncbi:sigma-E factor negative regulatory protein [Ectothiorhodospira lacustris]|uniref:sigma-E factor negative regulatory protein n=1 Tax=Ectothiorhodospira lacustris TaxID=2899127 RepID=UPI001EE8F4D0|nr:sigma-E factor negative regulatory protein [Ectothiorhodospira lacustris]MCG5509390.1 sigma-E factor negative regulatory protein [Ectothiorhodospira lacustris]MCG5521444.1 sigma-E factor negative regulatory protein [Ectothiorhodospira lacustris]
MTTTKEERLSALVDDEAEAFESRRLLDELAKNPEDLARWGRYHLIGDVMRGNLDRTAPPDFSARIMAAVAEEPQPAAHVSRTLQGRLLKPVAGMGMAAAVAVAVLVGLQNFTGDPADPAMEPVLAGSEPTIRAAQWDAGQRNALQSMLDPDLRAAQVQHSPLEYGGQQILRIDMGDARFSSYLINHAESAVGRGPVPPYARTVGHGFMGD